MGFYDSLLRNPGGSSIHDFGGSTDLDYGTPMAIDAEQRRRDFNDFTRKANFMSDLSNRQDRMRKIFADQTPSPGTPGVASPQNVIFKDNSIPPFQMAQLGLEKEKLGVDKSKVDQAGKLGAEKIDLGQQKHDLDVEKNKNIFDTKQADLQRKHDEAQKKLELAQKTLEQRGNDATAQLNFHKSKAEADAAKHNLDMAMKDKQHQDQMDEMKRLHDAQIKKIQDEKNVTTTDELDESGNKKTRTVTKGNKNGSNDDDPLGLRDME